MQASGESAKFGTVKEFSSTQREVPEFAGRESLGAFQNFDVTPTQFDYNKTTKAPDAMPFWAENSAG